MLRIVTKQSEMATKWLLIILNKFDIWKTRKKVDTSLMHLIISFVKLNKVIHKVVGVRIMAWENTNSKTRHASLTTCTNASKTAVSPFKQVNICIL